MKKLIEKIAKERNEFNLKMQNSADDESISILVSQTAIKFNYKIPDAYLEFLREVNGIFYNGIEIYATTNIYATTDIQQPINVIIEGFIEANDMWRESERKKKYIFFAESGDDLYVHNLNNNEYEYVDRITLEVIETIPNPKGLFNLILNHILENYD